MPYVNIKITREGATTEQKAKLIEGVTNLLRDVLNKNPATTVVVIDEVVGQLLALVAAPIHPLTALGGFLLFRLFDIFKPFPVRWFDQHIHGGLGIMLDDVMAGCYAFLILQLGLYFFPLS